MSFDPLDLSALRKRRRDLVKGDLDAKLAAEKRGQVSKLDGRRLRAGKSKTVQLNVRVDERDKLFIFALADEKEMTIVDVMSEAIQLLRGKHGKT
jgi:hypothetical protein